MPPCCAPRLAALLAAVVALCTGSTGGEAALLRRRAANFSTSNVMVRVPRTDRRSYEHTTLPNGLQVLVVEDPKAAKSGFAVAVSAGSLYDPPELPGLAHFCEHLLFLGTEKYPDEASFAAFLSQHDGSNNAYTAQERTVYYNEISHAGFDEGLDRFAQFFIAPLFKQEMVGRELEAVNSEHLKNMPDQGRRLWYLMRLLARNNSVTSRFYTGNAESLQHGNAETVAALKRYHRENYCAPRMRFVSVSNKPLAEQLRLVSQHFGGVQEGSCSPTPRDFEADQPFQDAASRSRFVQLRSDSAPQLWAMFPLPPIAKAYKAQPAIMLQYLLGYAGPASLKSELRAQDLATDMGMQVDQTSAATLVFLIFDLTPAGTQKPEAVAATLLDYLARLRDSGGAQVERIYPTIQKMTRVSFDYQEAPGSIMELVSGLSGSMLTYAPEDVLAGDAVVDNMDGHLVTQLLGQLTPENMNLALATKDFNESRANSFDRWYNVHYADSPFPQRMQEAWRNHPPSQNLQLPPPLRFVPSDLTVLSASAGSVPRQVAAVGAEAVKLGAHPEVWWLGKGLFSLPKVHLRVKLTVPGGLATNASHAALRRLHVQLATKGLEEPMEDLSECGLYWSLRDTSEGYQLEMDGYSEHISELVEKVADGITRPPLDETHVTQARQQLLDGLADATAKMPYEHAMEILAVVSTNSVFGREDLLAALKPLRAADVEAYLKSLQSDGLRVQLLATGNLPEQTAKSLADVITSKLGIQRVLNKSEAAESLALRVERPVEVRMANPILDDSNNAVINSYQFGVPTVAERVRLLMLGKMISQPAYDMLRTKEQLGYVVFAVVMPHLNTLDLRLIVQGAKAAPDDIDTRIEATLDAFGQSLANLTEAEFAGWKASLRSAINKTEENMAQEADRFWAQIASDELCFNRKELALAYLDSLKSPSDVVNQFQQLRNASRKISVRLFGSGVQDLTHKQGLAHPEQVLAFGDGVTDRLAVLHGQGKGYLPSGSTCSIS